MTTPPYMPLYPNDEIARVMTLDLDVIGVYFRLRCQLWINGGKLENSEKILSRAAGTHTNRWRKLYPKLRGLLVEYEDGTVSLKGLVEEYEKVTQKRRVLAANGRKGGRPKKTQETAENQEFDKANGFDDEKPDGFYSQKQNGASVGFDLPKPPSSSPIHHQKKRMMDEDPGPLVDNSPGGFQSIGAILSGQSERDMLAQVRQVFSEHGLRSPPDWHVLNQWMQGGAELECDILPVLQQVCARVSEKGISPPKSFHYFESAIERQVTKNRGNI